MSTWISERFAALYDWITAGFSNLYELIHDHMAVALAIAFLLPLVVWLICQILRILRVYVTLRNVLFVSVAVSAFIFCLPFYYAQELSQSNPLGAALMAFQHALRLFALDGDFIAVVKFISTDQPESVAQYYTAFSSFLCLLAPLLTFTVLLSFIKNLNAKFYYTLHLFRSTHVFSELNEKSLAMAKSLAEHHKMQCDDAAYRRWMAFKGFCSNVKRFFLFHLPNFFRTLFSKLFCRGKAKSTKREENKATASPWVVPSPPPKPDRSSRTYRVLSFLNLLPRFLTRPLIVFTDVLDKHEEEHYELISEARKLNAILFRQDLGSIHFRFCTSVWRSLSFYLISEDEPEKIRHATHIMSRYDYRNARLYVLSDNVECQLLLSTVNTHHLIVKRINDIQALVYHNLDRNGLRIFRRAQEYQRKQLLEEIARIADQQRLAAETDKNTAQANPPEVQETPSIPSLEPKERPTITAVVVGLGQYGMEMLRALYWYCQSIGSQFRLEIHAFDEREDAESKLHALCPDLKKGSVSDEEAADSGNCHEDDFYPTVHAGIAVDSREFADELEKIKNATFIFIGLGTDELNISTATYIRSLYEKWGCDPDIETVVYDSNISQKMSVHWNAADAEASKEKEPALIAHLKQLCRKADKSTDKKAINDRESGIKNHKGQAYRIHMIGDLERFYSATTLLHSELDEAGERCELRWTTAGLLNRYEERDVLKKVMEIVSDPERNFDPASSLIFFPKNQASADSLSAHVVGIEEAFNEAPLANITLESRRLLKLCLHEKIRETLGIRPDQALPSDALKRFCAVRGEGETIFAREDPVSECVIYDSATISPASGADPSAKQGCKPLAALYRMIRGARKKGLAPDKTAAKTFAQKLCCVEYDIHEFSEQIRTGISPGFRKVEYNYRSSISRAMRDRLRGEILKPNSTSGVKLYPLGNWSEEEIKSLMEAFPKAPQSRSLDEMKLIGKLEHPSWNAYMRAEGFSHGKNTNILAKQHNCLIATSALSAKQLRKDA